MPIKPIAAASALIALTLTTGCATEPNGLPHIGGPDNFGEANRQTMLAQVIDPDPVYSTGIPETSADHAAQAVERYRTDKVKKPERPRTTNVGTSGGGGGSSGGQN